MRHGLQITPHTSVSVTRMCPSTWDQLGTLGLPAPPHSFGHSDCTWDPEEQCWEHEILPHAGNFPLLCLHHTVGFLLSAPQVESELKSKYAPQWEEKQSGVPLWRELWLPISSSLSASWKASFMNSLETVVLSPLPGWCLLATNSEMRISPQEWWGRRCYHRRGLVPCSKPHILEDMDRSSWQVTRVTPWGLMGFRYWG